MEAFGLGALAFVGIWGYALYKWGLLKGLAIGWIPAGIGALIVSAVVGGLFFN